MVQSRPAVQLTDFWSSVEPANQIGSDVIVSNMRGGAKITELQDGLGLIDLRWSNKGRSLMHMLVFFVFFEKNHFSQRDEAGRSHRTRMLSGLMSACRMLHRLSSLRAKKSCWL